MEREQGRDLVEVLEEDERYRFGRLFRIVEARLRHRRADGSMSPPILRVDFERGPAVAVVLVREDTDQVVLVRQFRFSAYAEGRRAGRGAGCGWLLEILAGILEEGESPEVVARREAFEETGYRIPGDLVAMGSMLPSAGASSEVVHLFLASVTADDRVGEGGGLPGEHEDIEVVHMAVDEALAAVASGEIRDAKSIIALQRLALRRLATTEKTERGSP